MRRKSVPDPHWLTFLAAALLVSLALPPLARAEEPRLAIRHSGGESSTYPVSEIEQVVFEGDTLRILRAADSDGYALASIVRIEFLWGVTGVPNPEDAGHLLKAMHLFQNRPNPFTPETRIGFELPQAGRVGVAIYSADGRLIRTLIEDDRAAGYHEVIWDGRDAKGRKVAGGVYFYRLAALGIAESRRMIILP